MGLAWRACAGRAGGGNRGTSLYIAVAAVIVVDFWQAYANVATAQRAQENAVTEASDAFGMSVGRQQIGLYSTDDARGFNPSEAGNLRIDGLYFDQVGFAQPGTRITRGSSVHVGIGAQGFSFPAPTGVVNFDLRTPGKEAEAGVLLGVASYDQAYGEFDGQVSVIDEVLSLGGGIGYSRNSSYEIAHHTDDWDLGAIAKWRPFDGLTIIPFWSKSQHSEYGEKVHVFIGDAGWPKYRRVDLMPQPWADFRFEASTSGATARYEFGSDWRIDAGLFHSEVVFPMNIDPFLTNVAGDGTGHYSISASPAQASRSTSGEVRLTKRIASKDVSNSFHVSIKGRDRRNESGGFDTVDVGPATTTWVPQIPMPLFSPGETTRIQAKQITPGFAYEGILRGVGQLSLGVQKSFYERTITAPDLDPQTDEERPWLYNVGVAAHLGDKLSIYASYTRGFEEVGAAPLNAVNRDEAVPAQLTKQIDAGLRYQWMPKLTLIAGLFEIQKPYFDLDPENVYRQVGTTRNRGVELSLAGELIQELTVVAGITVIDPTVQYMTAGGEIEVEAVGPAPGLIRTNFQYRLPFVPGVIIEADVESTSKRYARYNTIRLPAVTTFGAGLRYETQILGKPSTLRLQLSNLTNQYSVTPEPSGRLVALDSRRFELSLAMDL